MDLDEDGEKLFRSFDPELTLGEEVMGSVFHYTNADGVVGIVSNNRLRASQASTLNDPQEGLWGWSLIQRRSAEMASADRSLKLVNDLLAKTTWSQVAWDAFVASATTRQGDLNQYRLYGMYQIELFACDWPVRALADPAPGVTVPTAKWRLVLYGEDAPRESIDQGLAWAAGQLAEWGEPAIDRVLRYMSRLALQCKTDAYRHEAEARLVYHINEKDWPQYVKIRTRGDLLIPYLEAVPLQQPWCAGSVQVGPGARSEVAAKSVRQLRSLMDADPAYSGLDLPVTVSDHQFQTWGA